MLTAKIEPIPPVLQAAIDHLVQWHLLPESRKPNSCIINFFDEVNIFYENNFLPSCDLQVWKSFVHVISLQIDLFSILIYQ